MTRMRAPGITFPEHGERNVGWPFDLGRMASGVAGAADRFTLETAAADPGMARNPRQGRLIQLDRPGNGEVTGNGNVVAVPRTSRLHAWFADSGLAPLP